MATGGRAAAGSGSAAIWKVTFEKDGPPAGTGGAAAAFSFGARTSLGVHGFGGPQEIQLTRGKAGSSAAAAEATTLPELRCRSTIYLLKQQVQRFFKQRR